MLKITGRILIILLVAATISGGLYWLVNSNVINLAQSEGGMGGPQFEGGRPDGNTSGFPRFEGEGPEGQPGMNGQRPGAGQGFGERRGARGETFLLMSLMGILQNVVVIALVTLLVTLIPKIVFRVSGRKPLRTS
jgi:hypothetical protein